jgi:predicted nuclease with TOPRIM domain
MENKALLRLEKDVDRMLGELRTSARRQNQLTLALDRNEAEIERLRGEVQRYRTERSDVRRTVDALIQRFERLDIDWDGIS